MSPLETTLRVEAPFDYADVVLTYSGPGTAAIISSPSDTEYVIEITGEGIYDFVAEVTDIYGYSYTDTISIVVFDPQGIDALLRAKWNGMKQALINVDIEGALGYHNPGSREKYGKIYTLFGSHLPDAGASLGDIHMVWVRNGLALYYTIRNEDGEEYIYDVLLSCDENGIWGIEQY